MATLVRAPEDLDARVRAAAEREGISLNAWWLAAAEAKLAREELDVRAAARLLNADPVTRYVLDRLGE